MAKKSTRPDPHAAALAEIAEWEAWFLQAQLDTIAANMDMYPAEREQAIVAAKSLAAAAGASKRHHYLSWQQRFR